MTRGTSNLAVCVWCGARPGSDPEYARAAQALALSLAAAGMTIIYGGARVGLMRVLADSALAAGGRVEGIICEPMLALGLAHTHLSSCSIVPDLAAQQVAMVERADVFIALPGGLGTLYELSMALTAAQIGLHSKPILVANIGGYFDRLLATLQRAVDVELASGEDLRMLHVYASVPEVMEALGALQDDTEGSELALASRAHAGRRAEIAVVVERLIQSADARPTNIAEDRAPSG